MTKRSYGCSIETKMIRDIAKYLLPLAVCAAALSACRKDSPEPLGEEISFRADAPEAENISATGRQASQNGLSAPETKGTKTVDSNLTAEPFGVYGGYSATKGAAATTNVFDHSSALKVSYNTSTNYWEYTRTGDKPKYYWKRNQHYRFRAYHPYGADVETGGSDVDAIQVRYRIIDEQYDLLVAFATRHPATDVEGTGRVPMNFSHALTALRFRIAFNKTVDKGTTDALTEFHLTGVQAAGLMKYSHATGDYLSPVITWTSDAFDSTTEFYRSTTQRNFGVYNPGDASSVEPVDIYGSSDADNVVFAIPQTCSDPQHGNTSIHFKTVGGGTVDHTAVLPTLEWESGKIYTYTLLIEKSSVEVVVTIKDWNEVQSTVDINI